MRIVLIVYLLFFLIQPSFSFSSTDSLEYLLSNSQGASRIKYLLKLSQHCRTDNPHKSISFGEEYLALARELQNTNEEIKALNNLGITYYQLGYYETTLEYFIKALDLAESTSNEIEVARSNNNLGNLFDEIGEKEKAILYYKRSLITKEKLNDKRGLANTLSNIGYIYNDIGNTDEAFNYFHRALSIDEEEGHLEGLFASLNNLGLCYTTKKEFDSALIYFNRAISLEDKIESSYDRANFFNSLGDIYRITGQNEKALKTYHKSIELSQPIKARSLLKDSFKGLAEVHSNYNDHQLAYSYFEKFSLINDSLYRENNSRKIATIESDYKMKKKEQELQLIVKEAEIQNLILTKNKHISYFLYTGVIFLLGFFLVFFQKYKYKVQSHYLLKAKNQLIETKNSNITDSINYAKGIQEAILPDLNILNKVFKEHFVICKPRDIVTGDFYWFTDKGDYLIMAVVDCTGHGVPGAFMNVMGNSLLNQIILDKNVINPSEILKELNKRILSMLHRNDFSNNNSDGMDVGIILYHKDSGKLVFSGAKHSIYIYKDRKLEVIKGNKISLGGSSQKERDFDEHEVFLNKDDSFYLFTDGIIDQFGEKTNKKFMSSRLKEVINSVNEKPMHLQSKIIEEVIFTWKGQLEQTDDMLMIGIKA